ncbi:MAG: hypothetical protein HKN30_02960 [Sulfitobacter sp.]|nr:hypothetical protein [Sulfitobacter sp.]
MARILLIVIAAAAIVAIVAILLTVWNAAFAAGSRNLRPLFGADKEGMMAPTGLQKVAFVALIVLLFGVASGWLGGM